jgi:uncharacterized protein
MVVWLRLLATLAAVGHTVAATEVIWRNVTSDPLNVAAATLLGIGSALWVGKAWHDPNRAWVDLLALRPARWRTIALAVLCGFALQVPLSELQNVAEYFFRLLSPQGWGSIAAVFFSLSVVAPLSEELLFRGLILTRLRQSHGWLVALSVSSLLFGLCHFQLVASLIPACAAGLLLGTIALRTGSTWPAIATHAAVNAAPLLFSERIVKVPGFNVVKEGVDHVPMPLLLTVSAIAVIAFTALIRLETPPPRA